ncbi:MAG TPA: malate synthase [Firmicutes bacterium]|jgi:hypothetical protein|nr:malate synthase [Bacillota bacterium]
MNLVNKKVTHRDFGKGNVISHDDSYIKISFESGVKRFIFPDAFGKYITLTDQELAGLVRKKILKKEEEKRKEALRLENAKALERQRLYALEQKKRVRRRKIHPELQSVFWCEADEEDTIFEEWKVFVGEIKSGARKGQPRRLTRMNQNSACLLTKRGPDMLEKDRHILGVFMVNEDFNGGLCQDGFIPAHPKHRFRLTEEESEKMLFWNYYVNKRFPDKMTWNSGRQRYFDNIWMAQILRDIVSLKEKTEEQEKAQQFFEYFCAINNVDENELPGPEGALKRA